MLSYRFPYSSPLSGLDLFHICQRLTQQRPHKATQQLRPCGARNFYYTRLVLWRQGVVPVVEPTAALLPLEVSTSFLGILPPIVGRLEADFGWAVRLLTAPATAGWQLLLDQPVPYTLVLQQKLAGCVGAAHVAPGQWVERWKVCQQQMGVQQRPALEGLLTPARLLVAPVARADDSEGAALRLLRARLAQDATERLWSRPPAGVYLYDEPLAHWLMWRLLEQPWFRELWRN